MGQMEKNQFSGHGTDENSRRDSYEWCVWSHKTDGTYNISL